jgi:protein-disulfide isomerase
MKNLFKAFTLVVLLSSGFFIFKNFNDKVKIQETQRLVDLKNEATVIDEVHKTDTGVSSEASYRNRKVPKDEINRLTEDDLYFGNKDSNVVMIEYESLTCTHCKIFNDTIFPEIKARYIDTGKILYIERSFPTDGISFKFAAMVNCMKDNKSKMLLRDLIFASQETLFKKLTRADLKAKFDIKEKTKEDEKYIEAEVYKILDEEIEDFGIVTNIDQKLLKSCIRNVDPNGPIAKSILNKSNAAYSGKYKINATPSFILNGKKYDGAQNASYWIKILDTEITKNSSKIQSDQVIQSDNNIDANEKHIMGSVVPEMKIAVEKFVETDSNKDETRDNVSISRDSLQENNEQLPNNIVDQNETQSNSTMLINQ